MTAEDRTISYAQRRIAAARQVGPLPSFGSDEWHALPADDVRRAGAVWVAALCWHLEYAPQRIAERIVDYWAATEQLADADWPDLAARVRGYADSPTRDELAARRALPQRREHDHDGGSVRWSA